MNYRKNNVRLSGARCRVLSLGFFRDYSYLFKDMKKLKMLALALVGIGALPVLAEGEASANAIDQIGATIVTEMTGWTTSITSFFVDNSSTIFSILGIAVAVSLIWVVFKFFRKGTNKVG